MLSIKKSSPNHWKKSGTNLSPIDLTANVGIGTASPGAKLTIDDPNGQDYPLSVVEGGLEFTPMDAPSTAPTATLNTDSGNVDGTNFAYKVTFVTDTGETLAGPSSNTIASATNQKIDLTNIPIGNSKVSARKIYRVSAAQNNFYYVLIATINDNTTTSYTDNATEPSFAENPAPSLNSTVGMTGLTKLDLGSSSLLSELNLNMSAARQYPLKFKSSGNDFISIGRGGSSDLNIVSPSSIHVRLSAGSNGATELSFQGAGVRGAITTDGSYNLAINNGAFGALKLNDTSAQNVEIAEGGGDIVLFGDIIADTAATVPVTIKGAASQSANLTEWQDSSGNVLAKVDASGDIVPVQRLILPMGEISYFDTTGTEITISAQSDGSSNMVLCNPTTALSSGAYEFDNGGGNTGRLRYTGTVTKMFHLACSISFSPATANDSFVIGIAKNGTVIAPSKVINEARGVGETSSTALHLMVELATNDYVELYVGNITTTGDFTIKTLSMFAMGV